MEGQKMQQICNTNCPRGKIRHPVNASREATPIRIASFSLCGAAAKSLSGLAAGNTRGPAAGRPAQ